MNSFVGYLYFLGPPVILIVAASAIGVYLARRGKRQKNASMMTCGIAILAAAVVITLGLIWYVNAIESNSNSMARIGLFIVPLGVVASFFAATAIFNQT